MGKKKKLNEKKKDRTELLRAPTHRKFYVTNVKGGFTSQDFRLEILNEKITNDEGKSSYISDALMIFSLIGAKRLSKFLSDSIKEYEKKNGEIPLEPEKEVLLRM